MDHIEKALKRAREQGSPEREPAPRSRAQEDTAAKREPLEEVTLSNTRIEPVGKRTLSEQRVIAGQVRDVCADTYRMLRAQVLFRLQELGGNTVGICSASPGEGKTLTAVNLAVSLALDPNYTVLLVDLDLRRPKLASYFGLAADKGLSNYLVGRCETDGLPSKPWLGAPGDHAGWSASL